MKYFIKLFSFIFVFSVLLFLPQIVLADQTTTLLPQSDGTYKQWTPKSGTTHFTQVDETTCDGATSFNQTTTVGNRDSYGINLSSIPNGSTITQVGITPCASRENSGGTNPIMNVFYRLNGINSADAGSYSLTGTTPVVLSVTSYTSLSTVKSSSSTLEIGAVLTSGTKGARLSQIATQITYTPLASPSGLTATKLSTNSAQLNWTDNSSNETGFKIERGIDGINFSQINTVGQNITSYTDASLSAGTYFYRVRATNSGGDSGYSNVANVTLP